MTEVKKAKHIKTQRNRLTKYNLTKKKKKEWNLSKSNNDPKIKKKPNKQRNKQKEKKYYLK